MLNIEQLVALCITATLLAAASWKWTLPLAKSVSLIIASVGAALMLGCLSQRLFDQPWEVAAITIVSGGWAYLLLLAWLFYRDPDRASPPDPRLVVSPADGKVIYIRKLKPGALPVAEKKGRKLLLTEIAQSCLKDQEVWQVGISMVFTDVHVNRAPIAGKVTMVKHRPGAFLSLRDEDAVGVNERQTMIIENENIQVGIVQIASRLVRRIEAYVKEGTEINKGVRIGIIKFGSQVDLFVPVGHLTALKVTEGQLLTAGTTIIGELASAMQGKPQP